MTAKEQRKKEFFTGFWVGCAVFGALILCLFGIVFLS